MWIRYNGLYSETNFYKKIKNFWNLNKNIQLFKIIMQRNLSFLLSGFIYKNKDAMSNDI